MWTATAKTQMSQHLIRKSYVRCSRQCRPNRLARELKTLSKVCWLVS